MPVFSFKVFSNGESPGQDGLGQDGMFEGPVMVVESLHR